MNISLVSRLPKLSESENELGLLLVHKNFACVKHNLGACGQSIIKISGIMKQKIP